MPNIFKRFGLGRAEAYQFPDTAEIVIQKDEPQPEPAEEPAEAAAEPSAEPEQNPAQTPIDFAQIQAESILEDARQQAAELLERTRATAAEEAATAREQARTEGYQEGFNQGMQQAAAEGARKLREAANDQAAEVQRYLEQAADTLDHQLDDSVDELRDLALAVAEKVVCVSLKSSSEVIARMIQTAIDKRKSREWVRIYVSESDAKRMVPLPESLTHSLASLSDRVRIIPMAGDEPGTCIIEMPDEIVDASASTQMNNLRSMLSSAPTMNFEGSPLF